MRINKVKTILLIRDTAKAVAPERPSVQRPESYRQAVLARMKRDGITAKDVATHDRLCRG